MNGMLPANVDDPRFAARAAASQPDDYARWTPGGAAQANLAAPVTPSGEETTLLVVDFLGQCLAAFVNWSN
jgi:hypothetical protein